MASKEIEDDGKQHYQRALTLLNEAVDILRAPCTATDHPQHPAHHPDPAQHPAHHADPAQHPDHPAHRSAASVQVPAPFTERGELQEMARLFPFYSQGASAGKVSSRQPFKRFRPSASSSGPKKSFRPKETWTHTFICLCESDQLAVPSREEKVILKEAGLGEKKITFEKYGGYQQLQSSLLKEFPKLSEGGGFQLLRSSGARRSLDLIPIPTMGYDIPYLKDCLGQAIGYVRPLQKDLDRSPLPVQKSTAVSNLQNAPKVICINCKDGVPLTLWQDHQMICEGGSSKETGDRCEESRDDRDNYVHTPMVQKSSTEERNTTQPTGEFSSAAVPIKNFDEMLGEILDVIPDANEQDVRKKLLATSSVEETLDWMLEQQNTIYQNSVMLKDLDPSEALETFRQATIMKLPYQTIRINRDSPHFIREVFKLFKKGIDVKKAPDVEFEGEDGMDASGLTREYLYLLMSKIRGGDGTTVLFEGQPGHLSPLYDVDCLDSGFYFFVGQALAQSFLHGGYPFVGMSQAVAHYIITDDIDESIPFLAVEDIPDPEVRDVLKKIASASKDEDFQNLNADEGVSNLLIQCGFVNKLLNKQNSQQACQRVLVHQVLMYKKDPIQEIRRGLQTASITSFLKDHPALWKTIFATAADVKLQSDLVVRSLKCDPSVGELNEQQETILNWCKEYVGNLPSDTESDSSTIEKFVQFVFGEPTMPPQPVYVKFNRPGKSLPDADACTGTISLPIDHKMKKDFTKSLDIVLNFQHKGFGRC